MSKLHKWPVYIFIVLAILGVAGMVIFFLFDCIIAWKVSGIVLIISIGAALAVVMFNELFE